MMKNGPTRQHNKGKGTGKYLLLPVMLAIVIMVAGCAAPNTRIASGNKTVIDRETQIQMEMALQAFHNRQTRLQKLAYPILHHNTELCGKHVAYRTGLQWDTLSHYDEEFQTAAAAVLQLDDRLHITGVLPDSPAEKAGLQAGDIITAMDGHKIPFPLTRKAFAKLHKTHASLAVRGRLIRFKIKRQEQAMIIMVKPEKHCHFNVILSNADMLNAFADGNNIIVTKGMMRFVENDRELQFIIAHELAHNAEKHINKKRNNAILGSILDILIATQGIDTQGAFGNAGAQAHSQDFEREADYVGMYMLARADISGAEVAHFWRRMAAENIAAIRRDYSSTHPSSPERFANIEAAWQEVQEKRRTNQPLLPNRKNGPAR